MNCSKVRLTDICKECGVGNTKADCPTYRDEGSAITYATPPYTVFDLVPSRDHVGEQVVCIDDHNSDQLKAGEIYTVIEQTNEQFGYIRLDKFKEYPNMWFAPDRFKKCKATYDGREYTLYLKS